MTCPICNHATHTGRCTHQLTEEVPGHLQGLVLTTTVTAGQCPCGLVNSLADLFNADDNPPYTVSATVAKRLGLGSGFLAELNEPRDPPRPPNCICRYPLHEAYADCPVHGHDAILSDTRRPR